MLHEAQISLAVLGFDAPYFFQSLLECPAIIEGGAVGVSEPVPRFQWYKFHMVMEVFPKEFKKLLKKKRCGDDDLPAPGIDQSG